MLIDTKLFATDLSNVDVVWHVQARKEAGVTGVEKEKELVSEAERLEVKEKAVTVLIELLFDTNILIQLKTYRSLLIRVRVKNV